MSRIEEILIKSGALLEGHFLLTSGRHGGKYMQCAKVLQYPAYAEEIVAEIVPFFADDGVDLVVAPAVGGIVFGYELARQLGVKSVFAERENNKMTLRRGFEILPGMRVLAAEDVVTTGGSVREVIELARACGAEVAGVAVMVDRSGGAVDFGVKMAAAYCAVIPTWEAGECPICEEGVLELVKPGSRALR